MSIESAKIEIRVPELGESIVEATVGKWLKHEGEHVEANEPLVELETEKVNLEVSAPQSGVLMKVFRPEGEIARVGELLAEIGDTSAQVVHEEAPITFEPKPATPLARKMAFEQGIDVESIQGSGPAGRVTKADIARQADLILPAPEAAPPTEPRAEAAGELGPRREPQVGPAQRGEERVRLSRRRLTIAERLMESQRSTASLTTFNEIDMSAVQSLRKRRGEAFQQRHGVKLGLMSFFVKASIAALRQFPMLNAEMQGEEVILKRYYDIGVAVSAEGGLVVPVVRDADRKSFAETEREIEELAARARENRLTLSDLQGGTFTITNGGVFGSLLSTPILNYPQVGILGMHKIEERPVAVGGQVEIRPMMYVALTYDHRVIDGREAVQFLVAVKRYVEDPEALLLEG